MFLVLSKTLGSESAKYAAKLQINVHSVTALTFFYDQVSKYFINAILFQFPFHVYFIQFCCSWISRNSCVFEEKTTKLKEVIFTAIKTCH